MRLVGRPLQDPAAEPVGRRAGRVGVAPVQAQLTADAAIEVRRQHAVQRVPVVGVVGMEHPDRTVEGERGEVDADVFRRRAQNLGVERDAGLDVAYQQVDGEPRHPLGVVARRHPPLVGIALHGHRSCPPRA